MRITFSEDITYLDPEARKCMDIFSKLRSLYVGEIDEFVPWLEKTIPCKVIRNSKEEAEIEIADEVYTMLVLRYG